MKKAFLAVVAVLLASAVEAQIREFPVNLVDGTHVFETPAPGSANGLTMRIKRCTALTPTFWCGEATTVFVRIWVSFDNGVTFNYRSCGFGGNGGILVSRFGTEIPESTVRCLIPDGQQRRLRVSAEVGNGPLVTEVTFEAITIAPTQ